jgi:peptidyl-prolyl cis-trans isomerase D
MITFLRRIVKSTFGKVVALLFLLAMGLSFAMSDVGRMTGGGSSTDLGTGIVAKAGSEKITLSQLRQRLQAAYTAAQQQQQGLTMAQFVAQGGLDNLVKELTDISAVEQYARELGVNIDDATVHAVIARNPAFAGMNGSFDQATFERTIAAQGLKPQDVIGQVRQSAIVRQLLAPIATVPAIPRGMTVAYASLLLEQRQGHAAFIPAQRFEPTAAPTDAQLSAFYTSQRARYTIPARRVIRYALVDSSAIKHVPDVTAADIQAEYTARAAEFAARESRGVAQVIAGSREVADRIATAVRGGASLQSAASAAGLQAATTTATSQQQFATTTNAEVARAVFAAQRGGIVGPVQVPLGWAVFRLETIDSTPAKTLAQATPEITTALRERKRKEAMDDLFNSAQDAVNGGASLTEVAQDKGLTITTTPAVLANGMSPADPSFRLPQQLAPILSAAFQADEGDGAQIIPIQQNEVFALVEVTQAIAPAPPPLASVRERVVADWRRAEGNKVARARARQMLTAIEGGQTIEAAASAAGVAGSVQVVGGRRIDLGRSQGGVSPEVALLFSMAPGTVKTLELPNNTGWMVLKLDHIQRNDASGIPQLLANVEQQFGQAISAEYVDIIVNAARQRYPVTIDTAAVARLRAELTGTATQPAAR